MDNRQIVKDFVSTWSDQKIAEVFAFNQDGKMDARSGCNCLLGVASSVFLHNTRCRIPHYLAIKHGGAYEEYGVKQDLRAYNAEIAYFKLGDPLIRYVPLEQGQPLRDRVFSEILTEVMAEREAAKLNYEQNPTPVACEV